ncbi:helix-turn-helix domain-containing protein [Aliidiomarina haloalkalitolerans]|uniref:HTH cro/C1-type domain-containing protein n=1 Tax=Aliidiomarina haloalkalitolerans TaxID=859059 RepID=A0A432VR28_9GAMM|nr:helix-turn-helix transcriptional regulator [Aliidiomarina haloalkalitolerans]RUO18718.1 hypothetical protein CWE06_10780 [Aliidiomarina haloalkalitolerans]
MDANEIKQKITEMGFSLTMIAETLGKSPSLVSKVVNGRSKSLLIAAAIAKILGRQIDEIFPNQYNTGFGRNYRYSSTYMAKQEELRRLVRQD